MKVTYCKELAHTIVGAHKCKIRKADWSAEDLMCGFEFKGCLETQGILSWILVFVSQDLQLTGWSGPVYGG